MIKANQPKKNAARYALLDEVRGLNLLSMILYHGLWDLVFLYGVRMDWYTGVPGMIWQRIGSGCFILLSGFCVLLGRRTAQRGAEIFGAGALVTLVTWAVLPDNLVLFGILTFFGSAMLLTALLRPVLDKAPAWGGLTVSAVLFLLTSKINAGFLGIGSLELVRLPQSWYANNLTAFLGFPQPTFYSTDYFPLFPWLFLFWTGYFLHRVVGRERMEPLRLSLCPPLGWLGRHSLIVYLLHQPMIYGLLLLWQNLRSF